MGEKPKTEQSFEEAIQNLDEIVKKLSEPELPLEDAFKAYEEGVILLKKCNDTLDGVEKKVIVINESGQKTDFKE